eukprot:TRINITY_DN483_c0_g1_i1.p2 TRINITY_DN483_c0_g1~~TRINITY_DN483_c0_g1_i1.p2  ORF type:complete len:118 (-),score=7.15 TRINITY_DN483_c0_g1_i1:185-538(-)
MTHSSTSTNHKNHNPVNHPHHPSTLLTTDQLHYNTTTNLQLVSSLPSIINIAGPPPSWNGVPPRLSNGYFYGGNHISEYFATRTRLPCSNGDIICPDQSIRRPLQLQGSFVSSSYSL